MNEASFHSLSEYRSITINDNYLNFKKITIVYVCQKSNVLICIKRCKINYDQTFNSHSKFENSWIGSIPFKENASTILNISSKIINCVSVYLSLNHTKSTGPIQQTCHAKLGSCSIFFTIERWR